MKSGLSKAMLAAGLLGAGLANATTYTSDPNLADFTSKVGTYAELSNFFSGDVASPYTPTTTTLDSGLRVYAGGSVAGLPSGNNWILATFGSAQSTILVFPNMDHFGSAYDGYQYQIWGLGANGGWTALFDATGVTGSGEPFTLGSFTGTAPTWVNNVGSPGNGPNGEVGYIAQFDFGTAYSEFAFGASTVAFQQGNSDQELSAVASESQSVPEPASLGLIGLGLAAVGMRRRKRMI